MFRKLSALVLTVLLCISLFAPAVATGESVTALEAGNTDILFSNGYRGFDIRYGDHEAEKDQRFTVCYTSFAKNTTSGKPVGEQLKVLFVEYFDTWFEQDANTGSFVLRNSQKDKLQHYIWHFSDDYASWRVSEEVVQNIRYLSLTNPIPDSGMQPIIVGDGRTSVVLDFIALDSEQEGIIDLFAYKITPVNDGNDGPPPIPAPADPSVPSTGDDTPVALWIMLAAISAAGAMWLVSRKRCCE